MRGVCEESGEHFHKWSAQLRLLVQRNVQPSRARRSRGKWDIMFRSKCGFFTLNSPVSLTSNLSRDLFPRLQHLDLHHMKINFDQPLILPELLSCSLDECESHGLKSALIFTSSQLPRLQQLSIDHDNHVRRFAPLLSQLQHLNFSALSLSGVPYLTRVSFQLLDIHCSQSPNRDLTDWLTTANTKDFYYDIHVEEDESWDVFFEALKTMMKVISQNRHIKLVSLEWMYKNHSTVRKDAWIQSFVEWTDLKNGFLATCRQRGIEVDSIDCQRFSSDSPWRWGDDTVSSIYPVVESFVL